MLSSHFALPKIKFQWYFYFFSLVLQFSLIVDIGINRTILETKDLGLREGKGALSTRSGGEAEAMCIQLLTY